MFGRRSPIDATATGSLADPSDRHHNAPPFTYNARLDGLRAVAVLGVIVGHAGLPNNGGYHGVTIFFVLSGYLITSLLVRELLNHRTISLTAFWRRRAARLMPALLLTGTVTSGFLILVGQFDKLSAAGLIGALTYTSD